MKITQSSISFFNVALREDVLKELFLPTRKP
jgi:hypothetical protein